jgi:hypothetical protein
MGALERGCLFFVIIGDALSESPTTAFTPQNGETYQDNNKPTQNRLLDGSVWMLGS